MTKKVDIHELIRQSLYESTDEDSDQQLQSEVAVGGIGGVGGSFGDKFKKSSESISDKLTGAARESWESAKKLGKSFTNWAEENPKLAASGTIGAAGLGALGAGAAALRRKRNSKI